MTNSRRNFCKNSVYLGLGLSFFPLITNAKTNVTNTKNVLKLTKKAEKIVKVNGTIQYEDLSPVRNTTIEVWHNNSENNPSNFDYEGKLMTDSEGNYSFETDFPEKHYDSEYLKTRRIYLKIKDQNGEEIVTKLHFGFDGKAFVDHLHVNRAPEKFKTLLPKTKFEENLYTVQFDWYLNTKVATKLA
jgi:protocatechuate 3,4-dioxygenase beta subunit